MKKNEGLAYLIYATDFIGVERFKITRPHLMLAVKYNITEDPMTTRIATVANLEGLSCVAIAVLLNTLRDSSEGAISKECLQQLLITTPKQFIDLYMSKAGETISDSDNTDLYACLTNRLLEFQGVLINAIDTYGLLDD